MMTRAVYAIECLANGKFYIGSTKKYEARHVCHKGFLRSNKHPNTPLQRAWNKYGEESFNFYILEKIEDPNTSLAERENYWINYHISSIGRPRLFNILLVAYSRSGFKITDKTRKKLSDAQRKRSRPKQSEETKAKRIATLKSKDIHPNSMNALRKSWASGHKPTPEVIEARVSKMRGKPLSKEMSDSHMKRMKTSDGVDRYKKRAKFSEEDIRIIISMRSSGYSFREIANKFNTKHPIVSRIFKKTVIYGTHVDPLPLNMHHFKKDRISIH